MIANPVTYEKDQLIRSIYSKQKNIAALLLNYKNRQDIVHLIYKWHSHKNFFIQNAAIINISLEELKERHVRISELLEEVKRHTDE